MNSTPSPFCVWRRVFPSLIAAFPLLAGGSLLNAQTVYSDLVQAGNPVAYWQFEEISGTDVADSSGNNHNAAIHQAAGAAGEFNLDVPGAFGVQGSGLQLIRGVGWDQHGYYAEVPYDPALSFTGSFTIEFSMNPDSDQFTYATFVGLVGQGNDTYQVRFDSNRPGLRFDVKGETAGANHVIASDVITWGEWHHVVAVYDMDAPQDNLQIWVDGVLEAVADREGPVATDTLGLQIGAHTPDGVLYQRLYKGFLDEVALYDYALSPAQVQAHWAAIPEPRTFALLLGGLALLAAGAYRARRRS